MVAYYVGCIDCYEMCIGLIGNGTLYKSLAASRRTIEQQALWWRYAKALEYFRMFQRKLDHFADRFHLLVESAYVLISRSIGFLLIAFEYIFDSMLHGGKYKKSDVKHVSRPIIDDELELILLLSLLLTNNHHHGK